MSIAIVVSGYDRYAKLWPAFAHGFKKYWQDCPWPKYFITNHMNGAQGFKTLKTGVETSWSNKILLGMSHIKEDIVLFLFEDYWLSGPVHTSTMIEFYDLMLKHPDIDTIRLRCPSYDSSLCPQKELTKPSELDSRLWEFKIDAPYRAAAYCNFHRKEALLRYMREGISCWDHETEASVRSTNSDKLYLCAIDPYIFPTVHQTNPFSNGNASEPCLKGLWTRSAIDYCREEGLIMNFNLHPNGCFNVEVK